MAVEYVGRKALSSGSRSLVSTSDVWGKVTHGEYISSETPRASMPRRPARPVIWRYSFGRQQAAAGAVELQHLADDDRARGHVDAQRERVGGEDGAQLARLEQLFDQQLDLRQQARVVDGDAARQEASEQQRDLAQLAVGRREVGQPALGFADELGGVRAPGAARRSSRRLLRWRGG